MQTIYFSEFAYLLVCGFVIYTFLYTDDKIYKIGSSECKGGIKNTFAFYEGGLGGSPSIRTFGIHLLIQEQLNLGKNIKIYALFIEPIKVIIPGLLSSVEKITYPQIKEMEDFYKAKKEKEKDNES